MKNRRTTIIVAIMVALVGTPRVWKEFGNILTSLQHKTQNRLLSMVVNSQVRESSDEVLAGIPQSEHLASHLASSCPAENLYQVADNHKSVNYSTPRKLKVERRELPSSDGFSPLAFNSLSTKSKKVALPPSANSLEWAGENQLAMHALASVPRELSNRSDVTEFVTLPQVNTIPQTFVMKEADLIKLKKSIEESKSMRQKVRYIISRNIPMPPST